MVDVGLGLGHPGPLQLQDRGVELVLPGPGPAQEREQRLVRVLDAVRPQPPPVPPDPDSLLGAVGHYRFELEVGEAPHAGVGGPGQERTHMIVVVLQRLLGDEVPLPLQPEVLVSDPELGTRRRSQCRASGRTVTRGAMGLILGTSSAASPRESPLSPFSQQGSSPVAGRPPTGYLPAPANT